MGSMLSSLEMLVTAPEQITWRPISTSGVWPDAMDGGQLKVWPVCFEAVVQLERAPNGMGPSLHPCFTLRPIEGVNRSMVVGPRRAAL
jgi:hypothetical protein